MIRSTIIKYGKNISHRAFKQNGYIKSIIVGMVCVGCIIFFSFVFRNKELDTYSGLIRSNVLFHNLDLPKQREITSLVPDINILTFFQAQSEELDALGASRSHFMTIEKDLSGFKDQNSLQKQDQEKSLEKLHDIQSNIKNNLQVTEQEIKKLEDSIRNSERAIRDLKKEEKDTQGLLKKFYQQKYIYDTFREKNINLVTLLLNKSFGKSIQDSEVMRMMQLFSYNLLIIQRETQEKINNTLKIIESQQEARIRIAIELEKYSTELVTTERIEAEIFGKTISRQGAIQDTLQSNQNTLQTLSEKFEQKFAKYEADILEYSKKYDCTNKKSDICIWIQGYIQAEKKLRLYETRLTEGAFPLQMYESLGFHFRDQSYHGLYQKHHNGLDIMAQKDAGIIAINDGYILGQKEPSGNTPGLMVIKHRDGYISLYKNIRPKKDIQLFSIIKKGDIIGTVGSFVEHSEKNNLHIEMYLRGVLVDPLEKMSLENALAKNIPGRYGWKYIDDLRRAKKEVDIPAIQKTIGFFYIPGENELERQKNMIEKYAGTAFRDQNMWVEESISESVDPSFVLCVGFAESTLGQNLTTDGNIGNVGNTDSGDRRSYDGPRAGVRAIAAVVNNRWLGHYKTIDQLSGWGNPRGPIYASSPTNWHENIIKCMSALKGKYVGNYSSFRLNAADLFNYEKAGYIK